MHIHRSGLGAADLTCLAIAANEKADFPREIGLNRVPLCESNLNAI